jgi:hypothetical protein
MIQLDIDPEIERRLVEAARARGLEPAAYASKILTDAVAYTSPKHLTAEEFEAAMNELAKYSTKIPDLPDDAYSRESIYRDHD